ncbi:hypothetical protein CGRA01v4_00070 [Colletotrichum graminicola]|nr:hypothetical protein CGRA01v4_00070 [Colletotrichum graminicola]
MAADNWVYDITSDDEDDGQRSDISFPNSELNHGIGSPPSQLCPIPGALSFLNYHEWAPGQSYDQQPPRWMLYYTSPYIRATPTSKPSENPAPVNNITFFKLL